nr:hypothetical protein [Oceaniglobus indicus]
MGVGLGPLSVIALILVLSGLLRLIGGTGQAIAREMGDLDVRGGGFANQSCEPPRDVATVLEALREREERLDEREARYAARSAKLATAEAEIADQLAALEAAERALEETLARADSAAETDVARLTAVYENMKPKEAALLFETMVPEFAAGFLGRMRPDAAAKVVEGLSPEAANVISVILAGRNANAPAR